MRDLHPKVLAFSSSNGGTGQTTISTHLALGLARAGKPVLLVEMQRPLMAGHYLASNSAVKSANPFIQNGMSSDTRQVEDNLWHTTPNPSSPDKIGALMEWASQISSRDFWLVLDLPRHLDARQHLDIEPDLEFHVLRSDPSSLTGLECLARQESIQIVLNQIDSRRRISKDIDRVLNTLFTDRIAARVHYDEAIPEALGEQRNLYDSAPQSLASQALLTLVNRVVSSDQPAPLIAASGTGD